MAGDNQQNSFNYKGFSRSIFICGHFLNLREKIFFRDYISNGFKNNISCNTFYFYSSYFLDFVLEIPYKWPHLEKRVEGFIQKTDQKIRVKSMIRSLISILLADNFL